MSLDRLKVNSSWTPATRSPGVTKQQIKWKGISLYNLFLSFSEYIQSNPRFRLPPLRQSDPLNSCDSGIPGSLFPGEPVLDLIRWPRSAFPSE
jgi:hypothetical protein